MPWLGPLFFILSPLASVSLRFLWGLALTTLRNRKPMRLRTSAIVRGEGKSSRTIPLRSERLQGRCGSQPRGGQARAKRRGLWRMRSGELTQRVSHLRRRLFPAFAATCRPTAHRDKGCQCVSRPSQAPPSGGPNQRWLPPAGDCRHPTSTSSRPQRRAGWGRSWWMPLGGDQPFVMDWATF